MKRPFPEAQRHGPLKEVFDDVFFVTGTVRMPGPIPITFSRNMVVLRNEGALTLVHSMRLDEAGLRALEKLGDVKHVIRLAGFHGMDDPFYKDRYGAKVWSVKGSVYSTGFSADPKPEQIYFEPDAVIDETTTLPIAGARLHRFPCAKGGEGLLLLERDGGIVVAGDSMQNWAATDAYFNLPGKVMMRGMGFIKPHNLGPGWLRAAQPETAGLRAVLDLPFSHLLPVHGEPVRGDAREKFRSRIEALG
jgi:hypothetical protein